MNCKKSLLAITIVFVFAACNNGGKEADSSQSKDSNSAVPPTQTREAKLYHETLQIHDEVMANMGKLNGYKKKVQQQADSIKTMLASTDFTIPMAQRIAGDLDTLNRLGKNLQAADSAMNAWMEQFNPDPQLANTEANADYFDKQKKMAETMKQQFFEALAAAEKKFNVNNK